MFLQALFEALAFSGFMIGMPLAFGILFDLLCWICRYAKGGQR